MWSWRVFERFRGRGGSSRRSYTSNLGESVKIPEPFREISYKDVKKVLLEPSLFVRSSTALAVLGALGAYVAYSMDWQNTPQSQLQVALENLKCEDTQAKVEGYEKLDKQLFAIRRVFSGPVGIPVSQDALTSEQLVTTLMKNIEVEEVSGRSLTWVYKLLSSIHGDKVLDTVLAVDPNLSTICKSLVSPDYGNTDEWLVASKIILDFAEDKQHKDKYQSVFQSNPDFINAIQAMASSPFPLAVATAHNLYELLPEDNPLDPEIANRLKQLNPSSRMHHEMTNLGLLEVGSYKSNPHIVTPRGPTSNSLSIAFFSTFAYFWGKMLWNFSISTSSSYKTLIEDQDPKRVRSLKKQFLRNSGVGRAVFALLTFDYLCSILLRSSSSSHLDFNADFPFHLPESISKQETPLCSSFPFVQSSLFLFGTIYSIYTHRFVVVPLLLAGAYNNLDIIDEKVGVPRPIMKVKDFFVENDPLSL
eukprot:TRINITY_DN24107_c0_g1_i1.p1 TRINITY_DN24107_c0_g1~~TRINITY_DN24107_c0_g1_i1.p1  ORF type:complete len:475 (+),score=78.40 TRINITY_DN24107_c0_g1_i1:17-1441(+)